MRLEDWPERLEAIIRRHQTATFKWGRFDCATLVSDAVWAMTGEDPLARFRPWMGESTASRALLSSGHRSVPSWIGSTFPEIACAKAGRGDLGYCAGDTGALQFPAIIMGAHCVSRDEHAWIVFPRDLLARTFKVG